MENKFFDLDSMEDNSTAPQTADHTTALREGMMVVKFMNIHYERISSVKNLVGRLPKEGEQYWLWTVNSFTAFTFVPFMIKECGIIDELTIATYSINKRIINSLVNLIDKGQIKHVDLYVSDSIRTKGVSVYDHLSSIIESYPDQIHVQYVWNHAKITLIRCGDLRFGIEGSGNHSENAEHEQYIFYNLPEAYEFRKNSLTNGAFTRST